MAMTTFRARVRGAKRSKLVWYGLAVAVLGYIESQRPALEALIPERYRGLVFVAIGLGIVVLRFATTQPLEALAPEPEPTDPDNEPA